jgi:hypothetical protein
MKEKFYKAEWEKIGLPLFPYYILRVKGGWLVVLYRGEIGSISFVSDAEHKNKPVPVEE